MTGLSEEHLRWACRRGMLELDLILQPFCETVYATLPSEAQQRFQALLSYPDPDLYQLLIGASVSSDSAMQNLIEQIKQHAQSCLPLSA